MRWKRLRYFVTQFIQNTKYCIPNFLRIGRVFIEDVKKRLVVF